jgi:hypothetical protein
MAAIDHAVIRVLEAFWHATVLPSDAPSSGICQPIDSQLDSMSSCDVLCQLEEILGMELEPERVIRRGGYSTCEQFVTELGSAVMKQVEESRK